MSEWKIPSKEQREADEARCVHCSHPRFDHHSNCLYPDCRCTRFSGDADAIATARFVLLDAIATTHGQSPEAQVEAILRQVSDPGVRWAFHALSSEKKR